MSYTWSFRPLAQFGHLWMSGLLCTLELTILAIVLGTCLAVPLVAATKSRVLALAVAARGWIDLFRAIPALVLLATLYFCLPILIGLRLSPFQVAVLGLTLNLAPFVAEVIRGAIDSVPRIQYESAFVLGFTGWRRTYYIIGPQVMQRMLPALVGQYVTTLKLTSLAAVIGVPELWNVTSQITTLTSLPLEAKLAGAALYVAIILPLLAVSLWIEGRLGVKGLGEWRER
jgi:polar amino acid transport system permease protein